ncbi:MAG: cation transporter [candidate division WOR-3 bacterium]|nr:MAG: cation transporter [candidate division WOR-3 bacterium]
MAEGRLVQSRQVRALNRRALGLSITTVAYNLLEGIASLIAGGMAGSVALVGFGLDSFTESLSGSIMIWRFGRHRDPEQTARAEARAVRLVGITFFVLGAYVLFESVRKFVAAAPPEPSLFGIIIAVISLISMPILYFAKRRTAKKLGSRSLAADSRQTLACMFLSFALLIGLGLNYLFGFWQADPIVGLLVVAYLVREGITALREKELCNC